MKILVLTDRYPPYYEGAYELNCYQITEGLKLRGHDLVVLTTTYGVKAKSIDGHIHRMLSNKSVHSLENWKRRINEIKQILMLKHDYNVMKLLAMEFKPDLVFVWHMSGTSLSPILATQDLGVRTVYRIGSQWLTSLKEDYALDSKNYFKKFYRLALMGFRRFEELNFRFGIMVGDSIKQKYRLSGFNVDDMVVIPSGIPVEWILKNGAKKINIDRHVRLLVAGRLEHEKGTDIALQAIHYLIRTLGYENISLDFIGKGKEPFLDTLKDSIKKNDLLNHVRLLGFFPRHELLDRFKDYDIVLFPSVNREGLPMTIIEAMSQGVPVIASDVGGPDDIIDNGKNGLLVPPNDPVALACAIQALVSSPEEINRLSAAAIQTVLHKFTFERMLDQYEAYLEYYL